MINRFPKDCWEKKCPHFKMFDLSIDDLCCYCELLKVQRDACDEDFSLCICPLTQQNDCKEKLVMTQKEVAIQCLKELNIYKPYVRKFEKDGTVTLFERFGGYYIDEYQEPELLHKIKEFEEEYGSIVYAVTHEMFWFGECYSFLIVSQYDEEWEMTLGDIKEGYAFSYVWNKTNEDCSEFGTIQVKSFGGGIARIA